MFRKMVMRITKYNSMSISRTLSSRKRANSMRDKQRILKFIAENKLLKFDKKVLMPRTFYYCIEHRRGGFSPCPKEHKK